MSPLPPIRPSTTTVLRQAQAVLAQRQFAAERTVATLKQRPTEHDVDFRLRVCAARARLPAARLLVVLCGPGAAPMAQGVVAIEIPAPLLALYCGSARYRVGYGGRGAGRSWTMARVALFESLARPLRILCAREFMNSLAESVLQLLADQITTLGLGKFFEVQSAGIFGANGSEFLFSGIRANVSRIKSMERLDRVWVEEAERISDESWRVLIPTVRAPGSEIWMTLNPMDETDSTYRRFVLAPPDDARVVKSNYSDNPWFPAVLESERAYLQRVDPDAYAHVWLGECRKHSDAQVLREKYAVEPFEPAAEWDGPYQGVDWGFSKDPTAAVRAYVHERTLYVSHEAYAVGCDIDRTPALLDAIPEARRYVLRADSARPETISYMQQHGYPHCVGVEKWSGSVEDGVAHLRAYERIVIHPRCAHLIEEARLYSYRVDRLSGDVLPEILDRHNHCIDALRYALAPLIRQSNARLGILHWIAAQPAPTPLAARADVKITPLSDPWHQ